MAFDPCCWRLLNVGYVVDEWDEDHYEKDVSMLSSALNLRLSLLPVHL